MRRQRPPGRRPRTLAPRRQGGYTHHGSGTGRISVLIRPIAHEQERTEDPGRLRQRIAWLRSDQIPTAVSASDTLRLGRCRLTPRCSRPYPRPAGGGKTAAGRSTRQCQTIGARSGAWRESGVGTPSDRFVTMRACGCVASGPSDCLRRIRRRGRRTTGCRKGSLRAR